MSITTGFISLISSKVNICTNSNDSLKKFDLTRPLPLKLASLVDHFLYQLDLDEELLACSYSLLKEFFGVINPNNLHKLVFTSLALAYKAFTDKPAKNSTLEKIGVLKSGELAELEKIMIEMVDWTLKYDQFDEILEMLSLCGKQEDSEEDLKEIEEYDTDFTEGGENDSFSELSAFF